MSFARNHRSQGGGAMYDERCFAFNSNNFHGRNDYDNNRNQNMNMITNRNKNNNNTNYFYYHSYNNSSSSNSIGSFNYNWNYDGFHDLLGRYGDHVSNSGNYYPKPSSNMPSYKRRKFGDGTRDDGRRQYPQTNAYGNVAPLTYNNSVPSAVRLNNEASTTSGGKRDRSQLEDDEPIFMSRDEIERYSPSRKDGIDVVRETHLRYSYCSFLQNLGMRLELPQTTIGTAMVLCHRFFIRRSHACHDRFLIATAALFLAAKSEETIRPLNDVLRASSEIYHKQDFAFLSYLLPVDWFEQYRERVIEAEQMILTTLNFEINVQHPYDPLTSVLSKLGLSQTMLVTLALNLISEGSSGTLSRVLDALVFFFSSVSKFSLIESILFSYEQLHYVVFLVWDNDCFGMPYNCRVFTRLACLPLSYC